MWALLLSAQPELGLAVLLAARPVFYQPLKLPALVPFGLGFSPETALGSAAPGRVQLGWNDLEEEEEEEQPRVKLEQLLVVLSAHLPSPWLISL